MNSYGFVRVSLVVPKLFLSNVIQNTEEHISLIKTLGSTTTQFICFPELSLTGYTCGDLFHQSQLIEEVENGIHKIIQVSSKYLNKVVIVGAPFHWRGNLYNCAYVLHQGKLLAIVPKTYLPNYNEHKEKIYFQACPKFAPLKISYTGINDSVWFGQQLLFEDSANSDLIMGLEICEDLWAPNPPSTNLCVQGATLIFNLSASNELVGKTDYRYRLVQQQSERCLSAYCYVSSGVGESTMDLVFGGHSFVYENGQLGNKLQKFLKKSTSMTLDLDLQRLSLERIRNTVWGDYADREVINNIQRIKITTKSIDFTTTSLLRTINKKPFVPFAQNSEALNKRCSEIFDIQANGLAMRWERTSAKKLIIGVSGGVDSTYALLICLEACSILKKSPDNILALNMPGYGTSKRTKSQISNLCKILNVNFEIIPIENAVNGHLKDLKHDGNFDITYENSQARERTQILFDKANQKEGMVVGTGDLSELALGWTTYNGDHMSSYGVNVSIPKTLIQFLIIWYSEFKINVKRVRILLNQILETPISPELLPLSTNDHILQKTEEIIGPFELHDFFLYYLVRHQFTPKKILFLAQIAFKENYSKIELKKWLNVFIKRFFKNQFKRSCLPDGPKVGSVSLSPRGEWRIPSDVSSDFWLKNIQ